MPKDSNKKEVMLRDWSNGIISDVDSQDAPPSSLLDADNVIYKSGYVETLTYDTQETLSGSISNPKSMIEIQSRYDTDGNYVDREYLYFYDAGDNTIKRFYKSVGSGTYTLDATFSHSCALPTEAIDFTTLGETVYASGDNYSNDAPIVPYNYQIFDSSYKRGWLSSVQTISFGSGEGTSDADIDTYLTANPTHVYIKYDETAATAGYQANDNVKYYIASVDEGGFESEPQLIVDRTISTLNNTMVFSIYAEPTVLDGIKEFKFYKDLNGGGKFWFASVDIKDGVESDATGNTFLVNGWLAHGTYSYYYSYFRDSAIFTVPYEYESNRNGDDKLPSATCTTHRGRILTAGERGQANGALLSSIYVSDPLLPSSMYSDNYLTINQAMNQEIKSIESWGNFVIAIFDNFAVAIDGSHPMPQYWKVIHTNFGGTTDHVGSISTDIGILFANTDGAWLFDGQFKDLIFDYNRDFYRDNIGSGDVYVVYEPKHKLFIVQGSSSTFLIDEKGRLSKSSSTSRIDRFITLDKHAASLTVDPIESATYLTKLYAGTTFRSGYIESNWIDFGNTHDKMLFKFKVDVMGKGTNPSATVVLYDEDGEFYNNTFNVIGDVDNDIIIPLKHRFKKLRYKVTFTGRLKNVSALVSSRKANRYD